MLNRSIALAAAVAAAALLPSQAPAQYPAANLPQNDFTWRWGEPPDRIRGSRDFSTRGNEDGFDCNLNGALRPGSRATQADVRRLENELGISLYFIQAATDAMNRLDRQRQLDWAQLECTKPEPRERDAEAQQERLDELRERALRRQAERRERRAEEEQED